MLHLPRLAPLATSSALALSLLLSACGSSRTTMARYPGAPAAFDRAGSAPEALAVADLVLTAAGGAEAWDKAHQIRWVQTLKRPDGTVQQTTVQAWDRWNARHHVRIDRGEAGAGVATYELYGDFGSAYTESAHGAKAVLPPSERAPAVDLARASWKIDTAALFMPFLMLEPGTKLEYAGTYKDPATQAEYHDLKVTFAATDAMRTGREYHAIVDKSTNLIRRVEIHASSGKAGYELADWVTVGGLKIPGTRKNLGNDEVTTATDIKVGEPDESLYVAPLQ